MPTPESSTSVPSDPSRRRSASTPIPSRSQSPTSQASHSNLAPHVGGHTFRKPDHNLSDPYLRIHRHRSSREVNVPKVDYQPAHTQFIRFLHVLYRARSVEDLAGRAELDDLAAGSELHRNEVDAPRFRQPGEEQDRYEDDAQNHQACGAAEPGAHYHTEADHAHGQGHVMEEVGMETRDDLIQQTEQAQGDNGHSYENPAKVGSLPGWWGSRHRRGWGRGG